ncbi:MAG TPA: hypothetical protein VGB76_03560 [Pyrinomonadaceae bacterium]|jgi:hypothetical protein
MTESRLGLKEKALLAALKCTGGDINKSFTLEDLLVEAWKQDHEAWGLRGYEKVYPDVDRLSKEINSRGKSLGAKGLVNDGFLAKQNSRVYRLTTKGLAFAARLKPDDETVQVKVTRALHNTIKSIMDNQVFRSWLTNPEQPKYFRDAGYFWGIAPGSPASTVKLRIGAVDSALKDAYEFLEIHGIDEVADSRSRILFDRKDIERCSEFQLVLKKRFAHELTILDPEIVNKDKD